MEWWGWMILGALLLGSELTFLDAAFYLVFLGIAAAITGFVLLSGVNLEAWTQWLIFGSLSLVTMLAFRGRLYDKLRNRGADYQGGPVGEFIRLEAPLAAGASCRQEYRGSTWTVINRSPSDIAGDTEAKILEVSGVNLIIK
jgi:membrane protein implicated in regulation of membrane protease activity